MKKLKGVLDGVLQSEILICMKFLNCVLAPPVFLKTLQGRGGCPTSVSCCIKNKTFFMSSCVRRERRSKRIKSEPRDAQ